MQTAAMFLSTENLEEAYDEEDKDSFTTKQLFSFAWQIAKGMVTFVNFLNYINASCLSLLTFLV